LAVQFSRTTRSLANDSSKFAYITWFFALVLLSAWLVWFVFSKVVIYEVSKKARLEVTQSPHSIASLVPSKIISNALVLGQQVKEGDILVELDATSEKLKLKEEEARAEALPLRIASTQKEIASLELAKEENQKSLLAALQTAKYRSQEAGAAVKFAEDNAKRLNEESNMGSVAKVDALRAQSEAQKLTASRGALSSEVSRVAREANTRADQDQAQIENLMRTIVVLEGEMATSKATIARLKQDIEKYVLRAPIAGRVGDVLQLKSGAYVSEGQKLATIVPSGGLIIMADFEPAAVLGRIHAGQISRMRLDGFPWAQYGTIEAKVSRVSTEIREGLVRVELAPVSTVASKALLQHGLPGTVEVSVEKITPAVLVLRAAGQLLPNQAQVDSQQTLSNGAAT
jgi:membrane fusion protein, adhesin transport system